MRVLILGGTADARTLADRLAGWPDLDVVSSLAGRVRVPRLPAGRVRVGAFGGANGLARYLAAERIERVIDATHPFATQITAHAVTAARACGVPLLVLHRPGWTEGPGDRWHRVATTADAAAAVWSAALAATPEASDGAVLLTVGRRDVTLFATDERHRYVVRSVEPPEGPLPPRHVLVLDRGPFTLDGERRLLTRHRVGLLVTRDSGGASTAAKLAAARELGIGVVLVARPPLPPGVGSVTSAAEAEAWLTSVA